MHDFEYPPDELLRGEKIRVRNVEILDGDSLGVTLPTGERCKVRLAGIDAPESKQPFGAEARDHLDGITRRSGNIYVRDIDDYGRIVAVMYCGREFYSLNMQMINAGYAYNYSRFGQLDRARSAQDVARRERRGMWASKSQLEKPWDYRARLENKPTLQDPEPIRTHIEGINRHQQRTERRHVRQARPKNETTPQDLEQDRPLIEDTRPRQSIPRHRRETERSRVRKLTISDPSTFIALVLAVVLIFLLISSVCSD